jgi:hypothetical protein
MLGRSEVIGRGVVSSPSRRFQMKFVGSHTRERLPGSARGSEKRANAFGFVPNLLGVMAEAPIALSAYIDLTDLLGKPA